MECEQMEKVSQLMDGELSDEEVAAVSTHVANCRVCERAAADFMSLRREIAAFDIELKPFVKQRVLRSLVASQNPPLWRRRISIPVPVMATLLLALLAIALWWTARSARLPPSQEVDVRRVTTEGQSQAAADLSRFDHGGRAAIEKIKQSGSVNQ